MTTLSTKKRKRKEIDDIHKKKSLTYIKKRAFTFIIIITALAIYKHNMVVYLFPYWYESSSLQ